MLEVTSQVCWEFINRTTENRREGFTGRVCDITLNPVQQPRSVVGVSSRIPLISSEFSGCLGQFAGNTSWNVSY